MTQKNKTLEDLKRLAADTTPDRVEPRKIGEAVHNAIRDILNGGAPDGTMRTLAMHEVNEGIAMGVASIYSVLFDGIEPEDRVEVARDIMVELSMNLQAALLHHTLKDHSK